MKIDIKGLVRKFKEPVKKAKDKIVQIEEKLKERGIITDEEIAKEMNMNKQFVRAIFGVILAKNKNVKWRIENKGDRAVTYLFYQKP